jgi:hypothetical protein
MVPPGFVNRRVPDDLAVAWKSFNVALVTSGRATTMRGKFMIKTPR